MTGEDMAGTARMKVLKKAVHWLLLLVVALYVVSGLGITEYRAVESLTFGLLSKALSFAVHGALLWPFLLLLGMHLWLTFAAPRLRRGKATKASGP
jgi:cytochrome b subunit of formate dehydrogenase